MSREDTGHPSLGEAGLTRRSFLRTAAVAGLGAAALAACGRGDTPAGSTGARGGETLEETALRIGYLPITDAAPLLLADANGGFRDRGLEAEARLFRSWPAIVEAFQARQIDVAHLLMPAAVNLRFAQEFPVKVVAWNHVNGSALTVANHIDAVEALAGQTIAVPFWYSIHNIALQILLRKHGLRPVLQGKASASEKTVKLVVMGPPDMPPALANGRIAGFIVADPFNAVAEVNKIGKVLRFTGDVWREHACCVVIMHEQHLEERPAWSQAVVSAVTDAQLYARTKRAHVPGELAKSGNGGYLPQPEPAIAKVFSEDTAPYESSGAIRHRDWDQQRIDFKPFPFPSYTAALVEHMSSTVVEGDSTFLSALDANGAHRELVDDRFVRKALRDAGGPGAFDLPESLSRTETIDA